MLRERQLRLMLPFFIQRLGVCQGWRGGQQDRYFSMQGGRGMNGTENLHKELRGPKVRYTMREC